MKRAWVIAALVTCLAASAVQGQAMPGRAAREAALLALIPRDAPQTMDEALAAQYSHDNPGKEAFIRKVLAEEVTCNNQLHAEDEKKTLRQTVHHLSDDALKQMTGFFSGPDFRRTAELLHKDPRTAEENTELQVLYTRYPLKDFFKAFASAERNITISPSISSSIIEEACREERDRQFDAAGITTLDGRLVDAVLAYRGQPDQLEAIKTLLAQGAKPHGASGHNVLLGITGSSALTYAISDNHADLVKLFLTQPVDIEMPVSGEQTLLMFAIHQTTYFPEKWPVQEDIIRQLIAAGANVNAVDHRHGETALSVAMGGFANPIDPVIVKMLLDAHADARWTTPGGFTLLMSGAAARLDIARLLIAAGTDPYAASDNGATALTFVCGLPALNEENQPDPTAAQRIALFLKPGTSINAQPKTSIRATPLVEAAITSHNRDCIRALIAAGASGDAPAFTDGYTIDHPEAKTTTARQEIQESLHYLAEHHFPSSKDYMDFLKSVNLINK